MDTISVLFRTFVRLGHTHHTTRKKVHPRHYKFFPVGLTMQHGDDGERGAAGPAARRTASPGAAVASSSAAGSEAQRAIPLEFLGRWLASEVGAVVDETHEAAGRRFCRDSHRVRAPLPPKKMVTELPQLMRVEYDDNAWFLSEGATQRAHQLVPDGRQQKSWLLLGAGRVCDS